MKAVYIYCVVAMVVGGSLSWCGGVPSAAGQDPPPKYTYSYAACDASPINCADCIVATFPGEGCGVQNYAAKDTKIKLCQQVTSKSSTCVDDKDVDETVTCSGGTYWECQKLDEKTFHCAPDPSKCTCGLAGGTDVGTFLILKACAK